MATYTFRLDAFTLISTACPSPYWDDLVVQVMVSVNKVPVHGFVVGHLGLLGRGGSVLFSDRKPHLRDNWEFEVELDDEIPQEVEVQVGIDNLRGLPNHDVAKFLVKLGVSVVGATVGGVVTIAETGAKVFVGVLGAVGGTTVSEFLGKLFGEVPDCVGTVFRRDIGFYSPTLKYLPYVWSGDTPYGVPQTWTNAIESESVGKPGEDCGMPQGVLTYSIIRTVPHPMFGSAKPPKQVATANTAMDLEQLSGAWADEVSSPYTRVWLEIGRSKSGGADLFDVKLREVAETPLGKTVAHGEFAGVPVTMQPQLAPQSAWYGKLHAFGPSLGLAPGAQLDTRHAHGQLAQSAETASDEAPEHADSDDRASAADGLATMVAKPALSQVVIDRRVVERQAVETVSAIRERVLVPHGGGLATLDQQPAPVMILPNGVVLSFWESRDEGSAKKGPPNGVITRYWRPGNAIATSTYVDLARWSPIR